MMASIDHLMAIVRGWIFSPLVLMAFWSEELEIRVHFEKTLALLTIVTAYKLHRMSVLLLVKAQSIDCQWDMTATTHATWLR